MNYFIIETTYTDGTISKRYGMSTDEPSEEVIKSLAKDDKKDVKSWTVIAITKEEYSANSAEGKAPWFL